MPPRGLTCVIARVLGLSPVMRLTAAPVPRGSRGTVTASPSDWGNQAAGHRGRPALARIPAGIRLLLRSLLHLTSFRQHFILGRSVHLPTPSGFVIGPAGGHRSPTQDRAKYFYILSIVHQALAACNFTRDQTPRRFNVETGPWKQQEKPSLPLDIPGRALSGKRCQPLLTACDPISLEHSLLHGIPGLECEVYLHRACNQHLARLNGRCRHIRVRPHLHSTAH